MVDLSFCWKGVLQSNATPGTYLTISGSQNGNQTSSWPSLAADTAAEAATFWVYETPNSFPSGNSTINGCIIQTIGNFPYIQYGTFYLSLMEDLGIITVTNDVTQAAMFGWSAPEDAATLTVWSPTQNQWLDIGYLTDNGQLFAVANSSGSGYNNSFLLNTFANGIQQLQNSLDGISQDFSQVILANCDLSNVSFQQGNFTAAQLINLNVAASNFSNAIFANAIIDNCNIANGIFDNAQFQSAFLTTLEWGNASAANANFTESTIVGAVLGGHFTECPTFTAADFTNASFNFCDFSNAVFDNTVMGPTSFIGCYFFQSDLSGANCIQNQTLTFDFSYLDSGTNFSTIPLYEASFDFTTFGGVIDFSSVQIPQSTSFVGAYAASAIFAGLSMEGADFSGACLVETDFTGCTLTSTPTNGTTAAGTPALFRGAMLQGAIFTGASLANADFTGAAVSSGPTNVTCNFPMETGKLQGNEPIPIGSATTGLENALAASTICAIGLTWQSCQTLQISAQQAMTVNAMPTSWRMLATVPRGLNGMPLVGPSNS